MPSMMGWVGRVKTFVGWVGLGPEILGWVGFWKSDPWPTLLQTTSSNLPTYCLCLGKLSLLSSPEIVAYIECRTGKGLIYRYLFAAVSHSVIIKTMKRKQTPGRIQIYTSCAGGRHNMSPPLQVDHWPSDLESGVRVTCDVGYLCANFSLPRPLCSRLRLDVRNRQTDRQTSDAHRRSMSPPYWDRDTISEHTYGGTWVQ